MVPVSSRYVWMGRAPPWLLFKSAFVARGTKSVGYATKVWVLDQSDSLHVTSWHFNLL